MINDILCNSCSQPAFSYDTDEATADAFDGKIFPCASCGFLGKVSVDYEYERASIDFHTMDETDIALNVEYSQLLEAYVLLQKKSCEDFEEICRLEKERA